MTALGRISLRLFAFGFGVWAASSLAMAQGGRAGGGAAGGGAVGGGAVGGGGAIGGGGAAGGGGGAFAPGTGGAGGNLGGNAGNTATARIVAAAGVLVGEPAQAVAIAPNQTTAAAGGGGAAPGGGGTAAPANTTYQWSIIDGHIVGSSTAATVNYVADTPGSVTLTVAITTAGATTNATTSIAAISAASAGPMTGPTTTAAAVGPDAETITVSVPPANEGDRTFRWSASGDAAIVSGQGTATATVRAGTPGLKEITCAVVLQRLFTINVRSFLVVTGNGPPVTVTVNSGAGGGTYPGGSRVDIFANPPPAGQVFDRWTGDTTIFGANAPLAPFIPHAVITVGTSAISLTATYKAAAAWTPVVVTNFNPQTPPAAPNQTTTPTAVSTSLAYFIPTRATGLVFLLHDTGGTANSWFNSPEGALFVHDLVAAGYGVAALNSVNRNGGRWSVQDTLENNLDALNHVAALTRFITDRAIADTTPIFFLGLGTGADAALSYADLLANAKPTRPVRGVVLYCSSGNEALAATARIPQYFALAANDDVIGANGNLAARNNSQLLAGRGVATGAFTNAVAPVYANRFRSLGATSTTFTNVDADAIWTAVDRAGLLDANHYPKSVPTNAEVSAALPESYRSRAADVAAELAVAYAAQEFFSEASARVIAFLDARVAGTVAATPGRLTNLSTRTKISYVGDSFTSGFGLAGPDKATLLIRAVGPGLVKFGLDQALSAVHLEVTDSTGKVIATNERWDAPGGTATAAQITTAGNGVGAFPLVAGDVDAAVLLTNLSAGTYTATVKGINGTTGDVLVEAYDITKNNTRFTNLSTLGKIANDGDTLLTGIFVQGNLRALLVRATGPALVEYGVPAEVVLPDPFVSILSGNTTLDSNNNWVQGGAATLSAVFPAVGAFPLKTTNTTDAAFVTAVGQGSYNLKAEAAPANPNQPVNPLRDTTGTVLVEVYEIP